MGNVDHGRVKSFVQRADLGTHLHAQLGVEIAQWLIEEKHLGFAHNGAPDSDALLLATRKFRRPPIEKLLNPEHIRGVFDAPQDFFLRHLSDLEIQGHVLIDAHVRIERVVLENHRYVAIPRVYVVHAAAINEDFALGDGFKTGQHAQRR